MSKKTFFYNINKTESHSLKLVNKEIIPQSFIREVFLENKNIKIIDNSYSISDILLKKKSNKKKIGNSIKVDNKILKNKFWHMLQLNVPIIANEKSKNVTINFVKNFSLFLKKQKVFITVLEAKKGGFIARSFGILGFLPLKHYISANKNLNNKQNFSLNLKKATKYYFLNICKLSLKQKAPLITKTRKWKFLTKARPWFKKNKKKFKKINILKTKKKIFLNKNKCPFIFYNAI